MGAAFKQFMAAPDNPIILRGDYLKATVIAYRDFEKQKAGQSKDTAPPQRSESADDTDVSKMDNYDVSIDLTAKSYIVQIGPSVRDPSHVVFGGGARYVIDRSSFRVLSRTFLK